MPLGRRLRENLGLTTLFLGLLFLGGTTAVALYGTRSRSFSVGQKIDQPIYAEVAFSITDEQRTMRDRQTARAATPSHYRLDEALITQIETDLRNLYQAAQASETFEAFLERATENGWTVDEAAYGQLRSYADATRQSAFEDCIVRLGRRLEREFTRHPDAEKDRSPPSSAKTIVIHLRDASEGEAPLEVSVFDILPLSNTTGIQRAANDLVLKCGFSPALRTTVADLLSRRLSEKPLLVFDAAVTAEQMVLAAERVETVTVRYQQNEPIIPVRAEGLTFADLQLVAAHDEAYRQFLVGDAEGAKDLRERALLRRIGLVTLFVLLTVVLLGYVATYQRRVLEVWTRGLAFVLLLVGTLAAVRVIDLASPIRELMVGPPLVAASILAIAYTRRFAMGVMTVTAVILVLAVHGDAALYITVLVGVGVTAWLLDDVRTRTRLIGVGLASAAAIFVSLTGSGLFDGQALGFAVIRGVQGAATAFVASLLLQATLPLLERFLGIVTSLTLLEWRDTTRPLLQRLAREAPGTYAHSLTLGTLAEAACREIGANALLAQVGALYHDIGKLHKASYFAENQEASINRHDNLAPTMSLLIIIGHVKDGLEMAKEYKLPRVLHPFIAEHHGTTVVRYFHHIASEQQPQIASGKHDRQVPESQFRYPGPKPRSKETAVMMLCDGTESAVRSLSEPTPGRIENVVHQIITDRLYDGQFDECDITLRELHRVEESLAKSLCSYYHGRVAYPKKDKPERAAGADQPQERTAAPIAG